MKALVFSKFAPEVTGLKFVLLLFEVFRMDA